MISLGVVAAPPAHAATGINKQINYQARLLNSAGATVPDGNYNLEFKIYQDGNGCVGGGSSPCSGTLKWTEDWLNNNSQGVTVTNGYFSVMLGAGSDSAALATAVDFNQSSLWLSVNIGNTNTSCATFGACSGDGEMLPFTQFAAAPYAFNSLAVGGIAASGLVQLSPASPQSGNISVTGTYNTNTFSSSALTFGAASTATIQSASSQALNISSNAASTWNTTSGNLTIQAASTNTLTLDTAGAGTVSVGASNAATTNVGRSGGATNISGDNITQKVSNSSTTALLLQTAGSTSILTADTTNSKLIVGSTVNSTSPGPILLVLGNQNASGDPAEVDGAMYYNSNTSNFRCGVKGTWQNCVGGLLSSNTSVSSSVGNCTTACAAFSITSSLPGNYCQPGRVIQITATGIYTSDAGTPAPQLGFGVYLGSNSTTKTSDTLVGFADTVATGTNNNNIGWGINFYMICVTTGSSGTVNGQGNTWIAKSTSTVANSPIYNNGSVTVNNQSTQTIYIFPAFNRAAAGLNATLEQLIVQGL